MYGHLFVDEDLALRVLFVAAEAFPLAKSGGLADVCGALPAELNRLGHDVRLMLPGYPQALDLALDKKTVLDDVGISGLGGLDGARLIGGVMPDTGLPVYLLDIPELFRRPGGLYQDPQGKDWGDNPLRFAALCHAAANLCRPRNGLGWSPDIVHANDWHTGLLPALLARRGESRPRTLFTIHNLAYQGNFPLETASMVGVPGDMLTPEGAEFHGQLSFLKAGIRYADKLTTVSPAYAKEILTADHGCGLDGLLRVRAADLVGVLNGIDHRIWDPATDEALAERYSADNQAGKQVCKAALQDELDLDRDADMPLVVFVNRLTHQKMADVLLEAVPAIMAQGVQLVLHGQGDRGLEDAFVAMTNSFPARTAVRIGYDERLAHRLNAAADLSLTASRFEPCGLTTMYAMRYGALPVTRPIGGLKDTVTDIESSWTGETAATGFLFSEDSASGMADGIRRAGEWVRTPNCRDRLRRNAMTRNFGWETSARRYLAIYKALVSRSDVQCLAPGPNIGLPAIDEAAPGTDTASPSNRPLH